MSQQANAKHRILLVLTGGTICSFADEKGERESDTARAQTLIVQNFRNGTSLYRDPEAVAFDPVSPLDILSENMTVTHWNTLIGALKSYDFSAYDGMIILHGTDTLAYTASLLSLLLAGIRIPIFLVSSQLPIYMEDANGNDNFRCAVELIAGGISPNVYAVYRNDEGAGDKRISQMYLHYGAHLRQCANHSDNFYSLDMIPLDGSVPALGASSAPAQDMLLYACPALSPCVLCITPYVGIDYSRFCLEGVRAVLHGTYHSSTMSVNPYGETKENAPESILYLKEKCDSHVPAIPLFIQPCNKDAYAYETTGIALRGGALPLFGTTPEMAYVKLLVGCALGLEGASLCDFMAKERCGEEIYRH